MKNPTPRISPLSHGQQALWYLNQLEPESTAYHVAICIELIGALNESALASAWEQLGIVHPQLRTRFFMRKGQPLMKIVPAPPVLRVEHHKNLSEVWNEVVRRPFTLSDEAPARAVLLREANGRSHLVLCAHHIITDLWSSAILLREFSSGYESCISPNNAHEIAAEKLEYTDFIAAERDWLQAPAGKEAWQFWERTFEGANLDPVFSCPTANESTGEIPVVLDAKDAELIQRTVRRLATTPYAVLLACHARLLGELTGRDDFFVGTAATIRDCAALRNTVGYFVNAVPIHCPIGTNNDGTLGVIAANAREALRYRRFPFPLLAERLGISRIPASTPIFQSMFVYQSLTRGQRDLLPLALGTDNFTWRWGGGLQARRIAMPSVDAQFPIALILGPGRDGYYGQFQYDGWSVTSAKAASLAKRFPELLREMLTEGKPRTKVTAATDAPQRLEELFDRTVDRMPDAPAVCENGRQLTYAEVKALADAFAAGLDMALSRRKGPVATQMPSCAEAAIIILGILKSGRAFQPVDVDEPEARRNRLLSRTAACALVSPREIDAAILPVGVQRLDPEKLMGPYVPNNRTRVTSQIAYCIQTSGSTGEPKSVEVEHAAIINHAQAVSRLFDLTPLDRVLQFHTLAFDAALEEIFPTWMAGGCVVFEPAVRQMSIPAFLEAMERKQVTVLNLPTSYWQLMIGEALHHKLKLPARVRLLVVGGEQALASTYLDWRKWAPDCRWINTYGPTEATVTSLAYEPSQAALSGDAVPIGQPIEGVTALLLNDDGKIISCGEGELLIGGKGLAAGYRGDPALTSARFVTHTWEDLPQRFYRTGDRVRLLPDGNFVFLGRFDRQLKIRGFRVEPDEIEKVLRAHRSVKEAVVLPRAIKGELGLDAFIARARAHLTIRQLQAHLARRLPAHMIPARMKFVPRLPRKSSGKIDNGALAVSGRKNQCREKSAPREMAVLFSEVLGRSVGFHDDFFQAGGHSLLAIRLLGRIESKFGVRVSLADFLARPTPHAVWKRTLGCSGSAVALTHEEFPSETPVSIQQRRALLGHEIGHPALANIVALWRIHGPINEKELRRSLESAAQQNFLVRARFVRTEHGFAVREAGQFPTLEHRAMRSRDPLRSAIELAKREGARPFSLDESRPWLRLLLVSTAPKNDKFLVLITHHAVADGWAMELLFQDLCEKSCKAGEVQAAPRDYRLYTQLQSRWLQSDGGRKQISSWKEQSSESDGPRFPFRRPSTSQASWQAGQRQLLLSAHLSRALRKVAASSRITPFALMMAGFKALIHRHSGQDRLALGSMASNRPTQADQNIFGPLQNPVLVRSEITSGMPVRAFAQHVFAALAEAQIHGIVPLEELPSHLKHASMRGGGIQFLSRDGLDNQLRLRSASLRAIELPATETPFEMSVAVSSAAARIKIVAEYQKSIYSASAVQCLLRQYAALLQALAENPDAAVGELNLHSAGDLSALQRRIETVHPARKELLHAGFEDQVCENPDALAVHDHERSLTYAELNALAESTARVLLETRLKPHGKVAVLLPKGWKQIVASLAVLKAGGCYVPLDPGLPDLRLQTIFEQGEFHAAIVADQKLQETAWAKNLRKVLTVDSRPELNNKRVQRTIPNPESLAYIIYTSGSTGMPKGVMMSHQAAMTTIAEINRRFQIKSDDRVLAVSSFAFDLSVFDIFGTLRAGGTIVLPRSHDPKEWLKQVCEQKVTVWNSVPCLFELLLNEAAGQSQSLASLRLVLLSGDFISLALAQHIRSVMPKARLVSLGGATEGGIWSIAREIKEVDSSWQRIPYGRPLRHQDLFVLDDLLNHCPPGVAGELFIAGSALADGYWRDHSETRRRFLRHPRWKIRLYRTGDKGRYLENGEIEILGRSDAQVKVNGVRIELGEVGAALGSHPSVRHATAEVQTDIAGNKRLVAFVVAEPGTTSTTLLAHAKKTLPAASVPSAFVLLEKFPLTSNGKLDRAALRAMNIASSAKTSAAPQNQAEKWIADLWSSLLGGVAVGAEDDFFALGGHSLLAIRMLQKVRTHFEVDLPLSHAIAHPTVRHLAEAVNAKSGKPQTGLTERATAELESDSEPKICRPIHWAAKKSGGILLTGVTGHLGRALLLELLNKTPDPIYCLVRSKSQMEAETRLRSILQARGIESSLQERIVVVSGDLGRQHLGLEQSAFDELAARIRAIYHCAAAVNFIEPYEKLASVNVGGVREMIHLAAAAGAVLHHVSSVAVFPYGGSRVRREDEDVSQIKTLMGGYAQSKWVAERMVWKAISRGLPAVIYRPAQIAGRMNGEPRDLLEHAAFACKILRSVPDIETTVDMVPADYAAAAIHALSLEASSLGKAFHVVHPNPISLREFAGLIPMPVVPLDAWVRSLSEEAARHEIPSLQFISLLAQGLNRRQLSPPRFDCSAAAIGLQRTGIVCPALDREFIEIHLAF